MPGQRTRGVLLKGVEGMPVQVPREILGCQARLGPAATLAWINLLALAQAGKPMHIDDLTESHGSSQVGGEQGPSPAGRPRVDQR